MDSNYFFSLVSQDIDEIPEALPAWDVEWRQLSRGGFCGQIKAAQLDGIELFYLSWNQAVQIQGSAPAGTVSFGIEISSQGRSIWRGLECDTQDILINSNREIDIKIPADYKMFVVTAKRDLLLEYADLQQRRLRRNDLKKSLGKANPAVLNAIRAYLQSSFTLLERDPDGKQYPDALSITQDITQDVMSLLITALLSAEDVSTRFPYLLQRVQIVKQLERYMLTHLDHSLAMDRLCAIAGISERSLNNYFHDLVDMSPMAYFKAIRLNRVRSALKSANPTTDKVASIAKQYGFQHMGYFSVDYKAMFGESPSETLWRSVYRVQGLQNFDSKSY
jgi:AraC family ethanolamine operon transcriptional activator